MNKLTVRDVDVEGKRVLLRVDFNVPVDEATGEITDDSRIRAALPTLGYLIERNARVVLATHLGRPRGKVDDRFRLAGVGERLSRILSRPVAVTADCVGPEVEKAVAALAGGGVLLLENLRFHAAEERNTPGFAHALSRLADVFVNDAFGTSHRSHASIVGVAGYLPAVAGFLLEKELTNLGDILESPAHPFAALLGGAKVSDKVGMLGNIMGKVDHLLIGGGVAATFLKAGGGKVGKSLVETNRLQTARHLMALAERQEVDLALPVDVVVVTEIEPEAATHTVAVSDIGARYRIVDIGPETVASFTGKLGECRTVFWNGPMGICEMPRFATGTRAMAEVLAESRAATILGGGSTAEAVAHFGLTERMTFVSTGGGASLAFLGGETLPGVEALLDR
ncbi:MAG: phosphoglycerate kinase [Dehalococcoidales bacterium]